jgi:hypothetical protein
MQFYASMHTTLVAPYNWFYGWLHVISLSSGFEIVAVSSIIVSGKDWSKECESQYPSIEKR